MGRAAEGGYGAYNSYISAATRYAVLGAPTLYDHTGPVYGSKYYCSYIEYFSSTLVHAGNLFSNLFDQEGNSAKDWAKRFLLEGFLRRQLLKIYVSILADLAAF